MPESKKVQEPMKEREILSAIRDLAKSQGYYSRMYRQILEAKENDPYEYLAWIQDLEREEFKDIIDLMMHLEGM
jgi:hypothetical protein